MRPEIALLIIFSSIVYICLAFVMAGFLWSGIKPKNFLEKLITLVMAIFWMVPLAVLITASLFWLGHNIGK